MGFSAVLFDLDGTLLDTLQDIADSANAALAEFGLPPHPAAAYKHFVGDGIMELVNRAFPAERLAGGGRERAAASLKAHYSRLWNAKTRPYPGVPGMLDGISALGLPMSVLSNKPQGFTEDCVRELLSRWRFAVVRGSQPGKALKPDPGPTLELAREMSIAPRDFLYLGDTATDMRTASAAGMHPVGALWGFRDADELAGAGARALIRRPEELLALLKGA